MKKAKKTRINHPTQTAAFIIMLYWIFGFSWIVVTDWLADWFLSDVAIAPWIQTIKGLLYVVLSGLVFYAIIHYHLKLYKDSFDRLELAYGELDMGHKKSLSLEEKLFDLAYYDPLTGLANKYLIEERINDQILKHPDQFIGLIYFDIDEFRSINEIKGHSLGDELIRDVADALKNEIQPPNVFSRMGGDEFLIAIFDLDHLELLIPKIEGYFNTIRKTYFLENDAFYLTFSSGVTLYPDHGKDFITLFRHADAAMSLAKSKGKDQYVIFDEEMVTIVKEQTELLNSLRKAIHHGEMSIHYQPIIELSTGNIHSVEALIRWYHPEKGFIPPLEFISLSEKNGLIRDITEFVLQDTADHFHAWNAKRSNFKVSINLSATMLMHERFIEDLFKWIDQHQIDCKRYIIEITETAIISDIQKSIHVLNQLRRLGFLIALDDFGTGYSSLTYLQKLPIDIIKIDRSFISGIKENTEEFYVLKYMIDLAHHLKLKVVAEGIETPEQRQMIVKYGVDFAQGYYFCKPSTQDRVYEYIVKSEAISI